MRSMSEHSVVDFPDPVGPVTSTRPREKLSETPIFSRGDYKQSEYGKVILPLTVLRRLDCVLEATKRAVLDRAEKLRGRVENMEPVLCAVSGEQFFNTSPLDLRRLLDEPGARECDAIAIGFGWIWNDERFSGAPFRFPDDDAKAAIEPGVAVKLLFEMRDGWCERMWVQRTNSSQGSA